MTFHATPSIQASTRAAEGSAALSGEMLRLALLPLLPSLPRSEGRAASGLVAWRLKRVLAFLDAHCADAITLADMARAAGLSRMHFAARFRISTGVKPHEYLLRLRIARARQLMVETEEPLAQIAFGVGFQTQAHFTTVFRRFTGTTPHRWRSAQPVRPSRGRGSAAHVGAQPQPQP